MNENIQNREYRGKGIITASCKKYMLQTLISLNILRDKGCDLPIELFYADDDEMEEADRTCLELSLNVKCVNVQSYNEFNGYNARNFSIKAIALYLSSFDETLWMDADIIPLMNLEDLFHQEHYKLHHHLFFEDIFSHVTNDNAFSDKTRKLYESFGVNIDAGTPETDSGIFLLHKSKFNPDLLYINLNLNINPNTYNHAYGDKELYRLSMTLSKSEINFTTIDQPPCIIGKYFEKEDLFCGNGVLLKMDSLFVCVHMTLHSVDHVNEYKDIWKKSFWTHYTTRGVSSLLQIVEPINQEILIKHAYDRKFMSPLNHLLSETQKDMYAYIHKFENNYLEIFYSDKSKE